MNRIRITAGELAADQAKEIARLAYEFGHGIVDVTTRANLQVQGLDIQHLPQVSRAARRRRADFEANGPRQYPQCLLRTRSAV